jgi:hypothetical protein
MPHPRRSNFILALATLAALVLAAEIALRIAAPVADPTRSGAQHVNALNPYIRFEYPKNYAAFTESEPELVGLEGRQSFTTNEYGFRGDSLAVPKPAGEFRIFVVGGSTAECFYLDDDDDMSRVAQNELALRAKDAHSIKVHNVGLSGTASDDHLAMIAQRLVHLEPDLLIVFAGINDLRRSLQGFDYLHYTSYGTTPSMPFCVVGRGPQIVRRLAYARRRVDPDPESVLETRALKSDYGRKIALQRATPEAGERYASTTSYGTTVRWSSRARIAGAVFAKHQHVELRRRSRSTQPPLDARLWQRGVSRGRHGLGVRTAQRRDADGRRGRLGIAVRPRARAAQVVGVLLRRLSLHARRGTRDGPRAGAPDEGVLVPAVIDRRERRVTRSARVWISGPCSVWGGCSREPARVPSGSMSAPEPKSC